MSETDLVIFALWRGTEKKYALKHRRLVRITQIFNKTTQNTLAVRGGLRS